MSPIIYTPHHCEKPGHDLPVGTLYQCPECDLIWELEADTVRDGKRLKWWAIEGPRRDIALGATRARAVQPATPTTPTVTPEMVQLALDMYWNHVDLRRDAEGEYTECAECGIGSYGFHTIMEHACEKAATALQDALRGETHG